MSSVYLVQARREQRHLDGSNGQLAREVAAALLGLGIGAGGEAADADDVSPAQVDVLLVKGRGLVVDVVGLREDLEARALERQSQRLCALAPASVGWRRPGTNIGANVVKVELAAGGALDVYSAGQLDGP